MAGLMTDFFIDLRQVFFAIGVLLFIVSYVEDHFNMYGYAFIFGVISIIVSFVCYIMYFNKKMN